MIEATRLDGVAIMVNADLIETVESVPDTVITLSTGRRLVVRESVADVVDRVVRYQQRVRRTPLGLASGAASSANLAADDAAPAEPGVRTRGSPSTSTSTGSEEHERQEMPPAAGAGAQ